MDERIQLLLVTLLSALAFVRGQHEGHEEHHRVNVSIYYESLCPDSKRFFTQQLYPSLQGNLSAFVNLTLVPYGKTKSKFDVNQYQFECHHGENECYGNKIQACALKLVDGGRNTPDVGFNKVSLGFINCLMDKADKNNMEIFPTKDCALYNHVSNLNDIENCANHSDASNYLAMYGSLTDAVQKPLKSVPTIVFDGVYKQEDTDLAQTNFVKALCRYVHGRQPPECTRNGGGAVGGAVLGVAALVVVALVGH